MLSYETIENMTDVLVDRITQLNTYILEKIGKNIKDIKTISDTNIIQLANMLKYGGSYEEIEKELARITGLNINEIESIFENVAKENYYFAKQFYDYRGVDYIPYNQNISLQNRVKAFSKLATEEYKKIAKSSAIGYFVTNSEGKKTFVNIKELYSEIVDKAVLSVELGQDSFTSQIYKSIKEIGTGSLRVMNGKKEVRRLDSMLRQNILERIVTMNNELQKEFGKEFDSDGIEISVHVNSAEDHEPVQGHQFTNNEFEKLQSNHFSYDVEGNYFDAIERPIGMWNCKHYIFPIIIGVNKPEYSKEELQAIIDDNNKGVELNGETYTKYQVTQMQRKLEQKVKEQKELYILAKASDDKQNMIESQQKISKYTTLYKIISKKANIKPRMDRMRVIGYHI